MFVYKIDRWREYKAILWDFLEKHADFCLTMAGFVQNKWVPSRVAATTKTSFSLLAWSELSADV